MDNIKPKIIVFDIGGVLLDWRSGLEKVAQALKESPEKFHEYLSLSLTDLEIGRLTPEEFWSKTAEVYKYNGSSQDLSSFWTDFQQVIPEGWQLAKDLKNAGYRIVACSNNWLGVIERQKESIHEFSIFETIVDSSRVGAKKPEEEIYRVVEKVTAHSGDELLLIDDSDKNIEGAINVGWLAHKFDYTVNEGVTDAEDIKSMLLKLKLL